jgi:hypothetical protein
MKKKYETVVVLGPVGSVEKPDWRVGTTTYVGGSGGYVGEASMHALGESWHADFPPVCSAVFSRAFPGLVHRLFDGRRRVMVYGVGGPAGVRPCTVEFLVDTGGGMSENGKSIA